MQARQSEEGNGEAGRRAWRAGDNLAGAEAEVQNLAGLKADLHETCDFLVENFDARQKARADEAWKQSPVVKGPASFRPGRSPLGSEVQPFRCQVTSFRRVVH